MTPLQNPEHRSEPSCSAHQGVVLSIVTTLRDVPPPDGVVNAYLHHHLCGHPWEEQLSLVAMALTALGYKPTPIVQVLRTLHNRFLAFTAASDRADPQVWRHPNTLSNYASRDLIPEDGSSIRETFLKTYWRAFDRTRYWLTTLPKETRRVLTPFLLPETDLAQLRALLRARTVPQSLLSVSGQRAASSPSVAHEETAGALLSAARLRHAHLCLLHLFYEEAVTRIALERPPLPVELAPLTATDGGRVLKLTLRMWDRAAITEAFPKQAALKQRQLPSTKSNIDDELFLEVISEQTTGDDPQDAWYVELLKRGVLGNRAGWGTGSNLAARQQWLRSQGYVGTTAKQTIRPFATAVPGLLAWAKARTVSHFVELWQPDLEGVLVPTSGLVAAASFGLLALELYVDGGLTGTDVLLAERNLPGPRALTVLQILTLVERSASSDQGLRQMRAHVLELQPERADMQKGVPLFSYNGYLIDDDGLAACLRFLLHTIDYEQNNERQTLDGRSVDRLADMLVRAPRKHSRMHA